LGNPDPWQEGRGREEKMREFLGPRGPRDPLGGWIKSLLELIRRLGGVSAGYEGWLVPCDSDATLSKALGALQNFYSEEYLVEPVALPQGGYGLYGAQKDLTTRRRDGLLEYLKARLKNKRG